MGSYIPQAEKGHIDVVFLADRISLRKLEETVSFSDIIDPHFASDIEEKKKVLEGENDTAILAGRESRDELEEIVKQFPDIAVLLLVQDEKDRDILSDRQHPFDDYIWMDDVLKNYNLLDKRVCNVVKSKKYNSAAEEILDRVTDGFLAIDDNSRFTYMNDEAARMLKKSREELVGDYIWNQFPEAIGTDFQEKYYEAMKEQKPVYFEEYYAPLDSWFAVKGYPTESGVTAYLQDITEKKKKEEELQKKVEQQEITTDLLRMALEERDIVDIQHAAVEKVAKALKNDYARILQVDEDGEELVLGAQHGMQMSEIGESDIEMDIHNQEAYTFLERESIQIEDYNRDREFERSRLMEFLNVRSGLSVIIGEYNDPRGVLSTFSRKTRGYTEGEIRFMEGVANVLATALEHQDKHIELKKYQRAVDSVNYGIYMIDNEEKIIMANEAFQDLSGYENEQLLGHSSDFLQSDSDKDGVLERSDGEKLDVEIHSVPIELPDGTTGEVSLVRQKKEEEN